MHNPDLTALDGSRRSFLKKSAAGAFVLAGNGFSAVAADDIYFKNAAAADIPWYRRVTRWGQINITEKDPPQYDISWWRKYWKETETEGIVVNAGGIVAYYPTHIPLQRKATYLGGRDLFGELRQAAREEGLVVFARMDSTGRMKNFIRPILTGLRWINPAIPIKRTTFSYPVSTVPIMKSIFRPF